VFEFLDHTKKKSAGEAMSRLWARFAGLFSSKSFIGVDKTGNKYFSRMEEIDGFVKEKRWVKFRREEDPTSIPGNSSLKHKMGCYIRPYIHLLE
jgi:NADH dehydrogenase [ubiquinone] 1 alpha subcomplex assembly factor 2